MSNDFKSNKFKELLDKLQQESWQLELLISGFAIFGLISALGPIESGLNEARALENPYFPKLYQIAFLSCYVLIINLIIHVIIRGLWIGAIGLRYVSNDIDYNELNYGKRFTKYLQKKVGSFDDYIAKLENYCSILFAVTFLTLFYIIAFFTTMFVIIIVGKITMDSGLFSEMVGAMILGFFGIFYLFLALFVFIDFITQGLLKKKEWTSFLYMPIYKVFSIITLSFLYRPLVYNFLDNKFGRRIAFILLPLYGSIFYLSSLNNVRSIYISENSYASENFSKNNNYLSLLEENQYVKIASIQSKIIEKPYLKIFIPFKEKMEDALLKHNKNLEPQEDNRGLKSDFVFITNSNSRKERKLHFKEKDSIYSLYLKTFNKNYLLEIDTISYTSNFLISTVNKQLGFETIIPIKNISEGKHLLKINRNIVIEKTKEIEIEKVIHIPFWYYKE
ncbi:MAG: hypothetical protein ABJH82_03520 [Polaribacter sp.]|uniref:hypothetical protein n=1 Tax=Polaribacter sp. TaxID=1920175 RepID=UPI003265A7A6